jgi:hypothetical protein
VVLDLAGFCDLYKTLPRSGGVLEQDAYQMYLISCYQEAAAERRQLELNKAKRS